MMNEESDRNPSPPPGLLQHLSDLMPDKIGDSVFSKHWLFQVLVSILENVNKEMSEDMEMQTSGKEPSEAMDIHELDPKLEEDACTLWDTSANTDVAHFLHEFKALEIFLEVIEKTKSPRLLEISVGILGNLASFDDLCQRMSANENLMKTIIPLSGTSDAPTIVQVLRLIHTSVVNKTVGSLWLEALNSDSSFMKNMKFILENSLNAGVLRGTLQLLYYILDADADVCIKWADREYVKSVVVAGQQLHNSKEFAALDELWLLLNLMCQHDGNVAAIAEFFMDLQPVYYSYVTSFSGDAEYSTLPPMERVAAVAASFTTLATLFSSNKVDYGALKNDDTFCKVIKNLYNSITEALDKASIIHDEESETEEENIADQPDFAASQDDKRVTETPVLAPACNGSSSNSSDRGKLTHMISLHEDDYNSLYILKESMTELCSISFPSLLPLKPGDG